MVFVHVMPCCGTVKSVLSEDQVQLIPKKCAVMQPSYVVKQQSCNLV